MLSLTRRTFLQLSSLTALPALRLASLKCHWATLTATRNAHIIDQWGHVLTLPARLEAGNHYQIVVTN